MFWRKKISPEERLKRRNDLEEFGRAKIELKALTAELERAVRRLEVAIAKYEQERKAPNGG